MSGTLSSLIMVYYSTELFVKCEESEIRSVSGHFGILHGYDRNGFKANSRRT